MDYCGENSNIPSHKCKANTSYPICFLCLIYIPFHVAVKILTIFVIISVNCKLHLNTCIYFHSFPFSEIFAGRQASDGQFAYTSVGFFYLL